MGTVYGYNDALLGTLRGLSLNTNRKRRWRKCPAEWSACQTSPPTQRTSWVEIWARGSTPRQSPSHPAWTRAPVGAGLTSPPSPQMWKLPQGREHKPRFHFPRMGGKLGLRSGTCSTAGIVANIKSCTSGPALEKLQPSQMGRLGKSREICHSLEEGLFPVPNSRRPFSLFSWMIKQGTLNH